MEEAGEAARTAAGLDEVLLDVKLSVPELPLRLVSRAPLIEAARSSGALSVGITAPAGYGKSTLLAQWAQCEDRPVGWVSLDRLDDDSSALHELHSSACHDVLSVVISGVPVGSQLVSASRVEQPHLARLRASGAVLDVLGPDLALDEAGAEQIFTAAQVPITREEAIVVTERTEGWAAGLHLAAMIARDTRQDVASISGDDRYVADYLYRESLSQQDAATQRFLRRTAVLDRLCGPLCDALSGDTDGQDQLVALEGSNSFLLPLDRRREWYRYHPLYREFLLGELRLPGGTCGDAA